MSSLSRHDHRPIFFQHVSTSGGTALCRWAQEQPCGTIPQCGANCNLQCHHPWNWRHHCERPACLQPSTPCRHPYKYSSKSCDGLARYARRRNLTFMASETMLPSYGRQCLERHFFGIIVLRDPVERLVSQFIRFHPDAPNAALNTILSRPYVFNTSERSSLFGTASVDNYLTRLLLGAPAFFLPLRGINASHRRAASKVLASFQLAIPLENLSASGASWLGPSLGWRGSLPKANTHHRRKRGLIAGRRKPAVVAAANAGRRLAAGWSAIHPPHLGERSLRILRALNRHDAELLREARERFARQRSEEAIGVSTLTQTSRLAGDYPMRPRSDRRTQMCRDRQCPVPSRSGR